MLNFPRKKIRAELIKKHLGCRKPIICFSCGNASKALEDLGLNVLSIAPDGDLETNRWFTKGEIEYHWPEHFDATSGHLNNYFMYELGKAYREHLGRLKRHERILCGSGETLVALKMAYPNTLFTAVYDDSQPHSRYNPMCEMNELVMESAYVVFRL